MPNRRRTRWAGRLAAGALAARRSRLGAGGPASFGPAPRDASGRFLNLAGEIPRAGPASPCRSSCGASRPRSRAGPARPSGSPTTGPSCARTPGTAFPPRPGSATPRCWSRWAGSASSPTRSGRPPRARSRGSGPRRWSPPGLELEALPPIDFVLISHSHYDHLDLPTLVRVARGDPGTRFLVPLGNAALLREAGLERVEEFDWGQGTQVGGVEITCVPSQHWSQRSLFDARRSLWCAWVVRSPGAALSTSWATAAGTPGSPTSAAPSAPSISRRSRSAPISPRR